MVINSDIPSVIQHSYGKSLFLLGRPTISLAIFCRELLNYQRVPSRTQTWPAGKLTIYYIGEFPKPAFSSGIFHCHVWLPEGIEKQVERRIPIFPEPRFTERTTTSEENSESILMNQPENYPQCQEVSQQPTHLGIMLSRPIPSSIPNATNPNWDSLPGFSDDSALLSQELSDFPIIPIYY